MNHFVNMKKTHVLYVSRNYLGTFGLGFASGRQILTIRDRSWSMIVSSRLGYILIKESKQLLYLVG